MTESCSLLVDGSAEVELFDDVHGAEVEVVHHDLREFLIGHSLSGSAVRFDVDAKGISKSNSVRYLDEDSVSELGSDQRFGDIASIVGCRSVDLGGVLSRVSTTSVRCPTTVGVDNNFSSSETGISSRTSNIEASRGVDDILGVDQEFLRANLLNDLIDKSIADGLVVDIGAVLGGDKNVEYSDGLQSSVVKFVFQDNLRFAIRSQPLNFS